MELVLLCTTGLRVTQKQNEDKLIYEASDARLTPRGLKNSSG
jgi:hypothetical protein